MLAWCHLHWIVHQLTAYAALKLIYEVLDKICIVLLLWFFYYTVFCCFFMLRKVGLILWFLGNVLV